MLFTRWIPRIFSAIRTTMKDVYKRQVLLGVLVYTAPVAFSMGASQTTANIWKSWCRMLGAALMSKP